MCAICGKKSMGGFNPQSVGMNRVRAHRRYVFEVRGLRERVRDGGLGIPLIAVESPGTTPAAALDPEHLGRKVQLPATAFLRLDGGLDEFLDGRLSGTLELYLVSDVRSVEVEGQAVPLTADLTVPLAYGLEGSQVWDFELQGFLHGSTRDLPTGIFLLQPYQHGKVPLVLVHGTASSPATWAQTINGLLADRRLRGHYQIWLALYNTGNPIIYSAGTVRESLRRLHSELDPDGSDPALSRMVVVGHSQGGLVARLLVTESGDRIWESLFDTPFEETSMDPKIHELLAQTIFFEPLPFIRRVVFIATPHRGSFVASGLIGRFASRMVELPRDLVELPSQLRARVALPPELRDIPTSVDNMSPGHRFARTLAGLPFAPGVGLHSIIAVEPGQEPIEEGDDGVVTYSSAHLLRRVARWRRPRGDPTGSCASRSASAPRRV
jgi:pimeloyl-ACP methyl ester carboxylesterase